MKTNIIKLIGAALIITGTLLALANEVKAQTDTIPPKEIKTCAGMTKTGQKCKSTFIVKGTDYCSAHNPEAVKCAGLTSKNEPCKMTVKQPSEYCRFHKEN